MGGTGVPAYHGAKFVAHVDEIDGANGLPPVRPASVPTLTIWEAPGG